MLTFFIALAVGVPLILAVHWATYGRHGQDQNLRERSHD